MTAREDTGTDRGASRATDRHHPWAGRSALVIPVVVFALGLFLVYGIIDMEIPEDSEEVFGPTAFPTITAIACFVIAVLLAVDILRNPEVPQDEDGDGLPDPGRVSNWRATGITVGSFVLFALLLQPVGWIITAAVTFWGVTVGLGSTKYVTNLVVGLGLSSIMQLIFAGALGLNLPPGVMGLF